jgi:hypothetical protein
LTLHVRCVLAPLTRRYGASEEHMDTTKSR